jgi:hypothetical protein
MIPMTRVTSRRWIRTAEWAREVEAAVPPSGLEL